MLGPTSRMFVFNFFVLPRKSAGDGTRMGRREMSREVRYGERRRVVLIVVVDAVAAPRETGAQVHSARVARAILVKIEEGLRI